MRLRQHGRPAVQASLPETALVDLHMHTTASDGIWSPSSLVEFAQSINLDLIAVTDHNTVKHIVPVREAAAGSNIFVLGGCEVSTVFGNKLFHVLHYGLDPHHSGWESIDRHVRAGRTRMYDEVITFLGKHGYQIDTSRLYVDPDTDEPVYIQYPIRTGLINGGYISADEKAGQAVEAILRATGVQFASHYSSIPLEELDELMGDAFAVRVIAHPGRDERNVSHRLDADTLRAMLDVIRIDGLEAQHPYHLSEQVTEYTEMAREFGLVVSCGSDAHHLRRPLLPHPITFCRDLMELCGVEVVI